MNALFLAVQDHASRSNALAKFVDPLLVERIGWTLFHSLWQFAIVAMQLMLCQRLLARRSAQARYLAGCVALFSMVVLAVGTFATLRNPEPPLVTEWTRPVEVEQPAQPEMQVAPMANDLAPQPNVPQIDEPTAAENAEDTFDAIESLPVIAIDPAQNIVSTSWRSRMIGLVEPWLSTAVLVWLIGVLLLAVRPCAGWLIIQRWRRRGTSPVPGDVAELFWRTAQRLGVHRTVVVLQSALVEVPAVIGHFRPLVLLPASVVTGLSVKELEAVLAHELAHIRRHDYLVNLGQMLIETLFFYHPAVWWVSRSIRLEREDCCDDQAVWLCGNKTVYAEALVALDQLRGSAPVPAMSGSGGSLLSRIRRIVGREEVASSGKAQGSLVLVALLLVGVALCVRPQVELAAQPENPDQKSETSEETKNPPANEKQPAERTVNRLDGLKPMPESIRVTLTLERNEYLLGESVAVDCELTNIHKTPVPYERGGVYPDLRINDGFRLSAVKLDADGKPIGRPVSATWTPGESSRNGPVGNFTLKPDERHVATLLVTRYLRFVEPGQYRLRVENVDRLTEGAVYAVGETLLTLKQPSLAEARGVFEAMKKAPRTAYDDNEMRFLRGAADFDAIHQPVYLPVLKEFAERGDLDALQSLERMDSLEANEVLVGVLSAALDKDDWRLGRVCFRHLKSSLPFPNWYYQPLPDYEKANRDRVERLYRTRFGPILVRLAMRLNVEVSAIMKERRKQPPETDANDKVFLSFFKRGYFPEEHPQAFLQDIDYIYKCVGTPGEMHHFLAAFAHSIELTKSLPLETNQYFRPRGSAYGFQHSLFQMLERGATLPSRPAHPGEAAAFVMMLQRKKSFRPEGWQKELLNWLKSDSPYLSEFILDHLPDPIPEEVFEYLPTAMAHDYVDLQIAACHVAEKHPREAFRKPLQKILDTAKDEYLRKYAVDAARANGIKAKYDPNAPFVDFSKEPADPPGDNPPAEKPEPNAPGAVDPQKPKAKVNPDPNRQTGSIYGVVLIDGPTPVVPKLKIRPLMAKVDPRNPEKPIKQAPPPVAEVDDDSLIIGKDGRLANVVVYLRKTPASYKPPPTPTKPVVITSTADRFTPRISILQVEQPLKLKVIGSGPDNFHSRPVKNNEFNLLVPANQEVTAPPFKLAESIPIRIQSDINYYKTAYQLVLEHPFAAITDKEGSYFIDEIPSGTHELYVWHERVGYLEKKMVVRVTTGEVTSVDLKYKAERFSEDRVANAVPEKVAQERAARFKENDREGAAKLVGRWMLSLPADFVYEAEFTQTTDGCLKLGGKKGTVLFGKFAVRGDRVELVEPGGTGIIDFVWQVQDKNTLKLIVDKNRVGATYLGAKLERIASTGGDGNARADAKAFLIPETVIGQSRTLAAAELAARKTLKGRRPAGLRELNSPEAIRAAAEQALRDMNDEKLKWEARERLRYLGDQAFDFLVQGAKSENPDVAWMCCSILMHRGVKGVPTLIEVLKSKAPARTRAAAADALGQTFQTDAVPALIAALDDPDTALQFSAMWALTYLRDRRAVEPLSRFTKNPGMGHVAIGALAHIQDSQGYVYWPPESLEFWQLCQDAHTLKGEGYGPKEIDLLIARLGSTSGDERSAGLLALARLDVRTAVPAVISSPNCDLKFQVLAELGTPEAFDYIVGRLHSLNLPTCAFAISGLSNGAGRWGAPLLVALLDDPSLKVAERGKKNSAPVQGGQTDYWPESHRAHSALCLYFSRFGLKGRTINLAEGHSNNVAEEIVRLKAWWKEHGQNFLAGRTVPSPDLTTVMSYR